jgi:hypothetical protein
MFARAPIAAPIPRSGKLLSFGTGPRAQGVEEVGGQTAKSIKLRNKLRGEPIATRNRRDGSLIGLATRERAQFALKVRRNDRFKEKIASKSADAPTPIQRDRPFAVENSEPDNIIDLK